MYFGGAGHIGEITAGAVLAAFGLAGAAAGVHEKQRSFRIHGNRWHDFAREFRKIFVDEEIAAFHKRRSGRVLARDAASKPGPCPPIWPSCLATSSAMSAVGLVVDQFAVAIVAVHGDQNAAAGIGGAHAASLAAEAAKHNRVDHAQAGASQHGDRQLGNHRHVNGDAIARLQTAKSRSSAANSFTRT